MAPSVNAERTMPDVSAKYACVVERRTGRLIAGKNEHSHASMASTTKIMTALLLCENTDLDQTAVVTDEMMRVEGSSMGLMPGDTVHYRDLLYGMLLASGNDAANATAILIDGTLTAFADRMNRRAAEIGMNDTHFVTPSGLDDDEHYSTAYDMALLACTALKNEQFAAAAASKSAVLEYGNPPYRRTLSNHNKLLAAMPECDGVKTGFTKKSGRCLVSSAWEGDKGVVAVTLNAPNDWEDHKALVAFGLSRLESREVEPPGLSDMTVLCGDQASLSVSIDRCTLSLLPEDFERITADVELGPTVFAPVSRSDVVGKVVYSLDGDVLKETDIVAEESVALNNTVRRKTVWDWLKIILVSK